MSPCLLHALYLNFNLLPGSLLVILVWMWLSLWLPRQTSFFHVHAPTSVSLPKLSCFAKSSEHASQETGPERGFRAWAAIPPGFSLHLFTHGRSARGVGGTGRNVLVLSPLSGGWM